MANMYGGRWKVVDDINRGGQGDVFRVLSRMMEHMEQQTERSRGERNAG
jgi:hypothetical protein